MNNKPVFNWELLIDGNKLVVNLNDGLNRKIQRDHPKYWENLKELRDEIDYSKRCGYKVRVKGEELLG